MTRVGKEPAATGRPVDLGPSRRHLVAAVVPGLGWECLEPWLEPAGTVARHLRQYGYDQVMIKVDALSSGANNARQIRDALMAMPVEAGGGTAGADRLLQGGDRHPRSPRDLPGDPRPGCRGGQRGGRDRRLAARERCGAVPGGPAAPLPAREMRLWRRRRGGEPAAGAAPGVACREPVAAGPALTTRWSPSRSPSASPRF